MPVNVLQIQELSINYHNRVAVNNVSLDVQEGEMLGIIGPNGAGKTTLFRAILGLQQYKGKLAMFGHGPNKFRSLIPLIGYVPQKITFEPNFPATVSDVVAMGIITKKRITHGVKLIQQCNCCWNRIYSLIDKKDDRILKALRTVGLEHLKNRRIGELSGGEQQRAFIAKALVKDPILLILDEPVTGVDSESQLSFYEIICKLNERYKITVIWSSHDLDAIKKYAGKVACMNQKLFFHGTKEQFFADEKILKTYTESAMQIHMREHDI